MKIPIYRILASVVILATLCGCVAGPTVTQQQIENSNVGQAPGESEFAKLKAFLVSIGRANNDSHLQVRTSKKDALRSGGKIYYGWNVSAHVDGSEWAFFTFNSVLYFYLPPENMKAGTWVLAETAELVQSKTRHTRDDYRKVTTINGPDSSEGASVVGGGSYQWHGTSWNLRTWDSTESCQLYVTVNPREWIFLGQAFDRDGARLDVTQIARDVQRGGYITEIIAVNFTRAYLIEHRTKGLDIRVDGQNGSVTIKVPVHYVDGFLRATTKPD